MRHEHMLAWTPEEDLLILRLFATEGRKWGKIAAALHGRSSASVRNRYLRIEKGRQLREEGKSKNRCAACGQHKLGHVCTVKAAAAGAPFTPPLTPPFTPTLTPPFTPTLTPPPTPTPAAAPAPQPVPPSPQREVSTDESGQPAPPIAASVVATIEPSLAAAPSSQASDAAGPSPTAPNLVITTTDLLDDDPTRRPAWVLVPAAMHHLQPLAPVLQRVPSAA